MVQEFAVRTATLDDVFLALTGDVFRTSEKETVNV
jgi:hypothetical protein